MQQVSLLYQNHKSNFCYEIKPPKTFKNSCKNTKAFSTQSWQFVISVCFAEFVANSYEFVQCHSYIFIQSVYVPLMVKIRRGTLCLRFLKTVCFRLIYIIQSHTKLPAHKIAMFSHKNEAGLFEKHEEVKREEILSRVSL